MIERLLREPTAIVGFVRALIYALVLFGLPWDDAQTIAVLAVIELGLVLVNRALVTSSASPSLEIAKPVRVAGTADTPPPDAIVARRADVIPGSPTDALAVMHNQGRA